MSNVARVSEPIEETAMTFVVAQPAAAAVANHANVGACAQAQVAARGGAG